MFPTDKSRGSQSAQGAGCRAEREACADYKRSDASGQVPFGLGAQRHYSLEHHEPLCQICDESFPSLMYVSCCPEATKCPK